MYQSILHIELRKVLPVYIAAAAAIIGYVIFRPNPLKAGDITAVVGGFLEGFIVTWIIFYDTSTVECFLFSRGITRQNLFWARWMLACGLLTMTLVIAAAVISAGMRCLIFVNGPWQPMVKWYELNILWPLGLGSFIGFSMRLFLLLRDRFMRPDKMPSTMRGVFKYIMLIAGVASVAWLGYVTPHIDMPTNYLLAAFLYTAGLLVLSTGTARSCFLKMEIHA